MRISSLGADAREVSRAVAPLDRGALQGWAYQEHAIVMARQGIRVDGGRFLRIDYDPARALVAAGDPIELRLTARTLEPITKQPLDALAVATYPMTPSVEGSYVAELRAPHHSPLAESVTPVYPATWLDVLDVNPILGRVAPLRLEMRFQGAADGLSDPPADREPYRVDLNTMQQRDRANVARQTYPMGTGEQVASFLYTNPNARGLGMLKKIQPPYEELTSDLRLLWEYRVPADGWVTPHGHVSEELWYVIQGEGTYVQDGEERIIRVGDAVIVYPGSWHGMRADRGDFGFLVIDVGVNAEGEAH